MRNLIFAAASLIILSPSAAFAQSSQGDHLSVEQVMSDVDLAKDAYGRIHPGYTRYTNAAELDAAWNDVIADAHARNCLLYTSPSPRDQRGSRMPSSA